METAAFILFAWLNKKFMGSECATDRKLMLKGALERILVFWGLLAGYPHVITAVAAIKLGTRLDEHTREKIENDYFIVGSFTSLLLAIVSASIAGKFFS